MATLYTDPQRLGPQPHLTRRSPHSFVCDSTEAFSRWLADNNFHQVAPSRSLVEHSRWERNRRIVIVYNSGSIVVQGPNPQPCIDLLATLVEEAEVLV
jgi:hypothetical protein